MNSDGLLLGLDAAWTENGTSGVALLSIQEGERRIIATSSSYTDFGTGEGENIAQRLLKSAHVIAGRRVDVVAIDMPIAQYAITGRREADNAVARAFGKYGAGTHSPSETRPGHFGRNLYLDFVREGYELPMKDQKQARSPAIIEVFPLAALVRLLRPARRPTYKVVKARKYWPSLTPTESIGALLEQWRAIDAALSGELAFTGIDVPEPAEVKSRASLKPYEDKMDAIVCAWVGARYLDGTAEPFGDENAAIWVPVDRAAALKGELLAP